MPVPFALLSSEMSPDEAHIHWQARSVSTQEWGLQRRAYLQKHHDRLVHLVRGIGFEGNDLEGDYSSRSLLRPQGRQMR